MCALNNFLTGVKKVSIEQALELLQVEDSKYSNIEDKNYYLVHIYNEILKEISFEDLEILKDIICRQYEYKIYKSFLYYICMVSKHINLEEDKIYKPEDKSDDKEMPKSIIDFYDSYDNNMILFIKGHLFIEYYMQVCIKKINVKIKNFYNKIQLMYNYHLISDYMKTLLEKINKIRNDIAHEIKYKLKFDTVFELINLSVMAGVDYSDDTIYINKKLSYEWYGIEGILNELFPNTIYTILDNCKELFTNEELNDLLN